MSDSNRTIPKDDYRENKSKSSEDEQDITENTKTKSQPCENSREQVMHGTGTGLIQELGTRVRAFEEMKEQLKLHGCNTSGSFEELQSRIE